jgi:hypothetical protein
MENLDLLAALQLLKLRLRSLERGFDLGVTLNLLACCH